MRTKDKIQERRNTGKKQIDTMRRTQKYREGKQRKQ